MNTQERSACKTTCQKKIEHAFNVENDGSSDNNDEKKNKNGNDTEKRECREKK